MSQKIYRNVLRDAWAVTWRYPALWIFGAFALFMGQSQFFYSLAGLFRLTAVSTRTAELFTVTRDWLLPVARPSFWEMIAGFGVAALVFVVFLLFVFMVIQSQGAIMAAGDHIFRKRLYSFKGAWVAALNHFWRLVIILAAKVVAALITAGGLGLVGTAVTAWPNAWWPKIIFVLGFVLLAVFDIFATFSVLFATCYVVLENETTGQALVRGVKLFARHWLAALEIGVVFVILNAVFLVVAKIVFALLFIPLIYFAAIVNAATGTIAPVIAINFLIMFVGAWAVMAIYATWFFMSVVILFDHMHSNVVVSKIIRFVQGLANRA